MFWLVNKLGQFVYHWRRAWSSGCHNGHSIPRTSANGLKRGDKFYLFRSCHAEDCMVDAQALNKELQERTARVLYGSR
jgi:hypothetical protein